MLELRSKLINAESINEVNNMMSSMNDIFKLQDTYDAKIMDEKLIEKSKQLGY